MNRFSEKYVLYVDDEPQATKYFSALFGDQFLVSVAQSADEAWDYVQENEENIAVVVTDQRMPETTGTELMERLKARCPNIVRVLTTAFSNLDAAIQAVNEGGAFRYLTKPWDEGEMIGTLMRAIEFHDLLQQRDQLLSEKLSVLHRLVVMDRVRGLATAATALNGQLRGAWRALSKYIEKSPTREQVRLQLADIGEMNMTAVARREAEQMVQTVQLIVADTVGASTGDDASVDIAAIVHQVTDSMRQQLADDDIEMSIQIPESLSAFSDAGMFTKLVEIMVRRLADIQDQPAKIEIEMNADSAAATLSTRGNFAPLTSEQLAAFFAAAIPLKKWPIGLDMDLLSAFMIVQHLGGSFEIDDQASSLTAVLPIGKTESESLETGAASFDQVYESLKEWERELILI